MLSNRIIVSGLALGCDRLAHEGALTINTPTIAVLPSGVNNIVPASHQDLAMEIVKKGGCLLSEYEPDSPGFRAAFVERDRLIAALTDILYVMECDEKSGTMLTVNEAYKMGRKLTCYYPNQEALQEGACKTDYLGNKKMMETLGAISISGDNELDTLFNEDIKNKSDVQNNSEEIYRQLSFEDFLL